MSKELTAKEVLETIEEICRKADCGVCPLKIEGHCVNNSNDFGLFADEIIEACKNWKLQHVKAETEWVHVCRIIEDTGDRKRCVYEKEIAEDDVLPFDFCDGAAEKNPQRILQEPQRELLCNS